jgi:hypothetical protein
MKLVICEKPSQAQAYAAVLGVNIRRDGFIEVIFSEFCLTRYTHK